MFMLRIMYMCVCASGEGGICHNDHKGLRIRLERSKAHFPKSILADSPDTAGWRSLGGFSSEFLPEDDEDFAGKSNNHRRKKLNYPPPPDVEDSSELWDLPPYPRSFRRSPLLRQFPIGVESTVQGDGLPSDRTTYSADSSTPSSHHHHHHAHRKYEMLLQQDIPSDFLASMNHSKGGGVEDISTKTLAKLMREATEGVEKSGEEGKK
mmetsp:Transcript_14762/g.23431  ORF Transcript_14762/g.23431 Transcript_14762/m.23431 type:complete len:208 (+) Transcript_14762:492-1115(+)